MSADKPVAYFLYEKSSVDGHWQPVVYYDKPSPLIASTPERYGEQPLYRNDIGTLLSPDCSPIFGALQTKYPAPEPVKEPIQGFIVPAEAGAELTAAE